MTSSSCHRFLNNHANSPHFVEYLFANIAHDVTYDFSEKLLQVFGLCLILEMWLPVDLLVSIQLDIEHRILIPSAVFEVELHQLGDLYHVTEVLGKVQVLINTDHAMSHFVLNLLLILVKCLLDLNEGLQLYLCVNFRIRMSDIRVFHEVEIVIVVLEYFIRGCMGSLLAIYEVIINTLKFEGANDFVRCSWALTAWRRPLSITNGRHQPRAVIRARPSLFDGLFLFQKVHIGKRNWLIWYLGEVLEWAVLRAARHLWSLIVWTGGQIEPLLFLNVKRLVRRICAIIYKGGKNQSLNIVCKTNDLKNCLKNDAILFLYVAFTGYKRIVFQQIDRSNC